MTTPAPQGLGPDAVEETALARSQAARRRRVLDAALRLAEQGGFDAVQMRDVATEANVALGTVYRYFTSKERLLLEAMVEQIQTLAARVESRPPIGETPAIRVLDVLTRANASLQRHPEVTAAMVRAFGAAAPEEADVVRRVSDSMTAIITGAMHHTVSFGAVASSGFASAVGKAAASPPSPRDLATARVLMQVWLSSLVGWVGGVDDATRVVADLSIAAQLLLEPGVEFAAASS